MNQFVEGLWNSHNESLLRPQNFLFFLFLNCNSYLQCPFRVHLDLLASFWTVFYFAIIMLG